MRGADGAALLLGLSLMSPKKQGASLLIQWLRLGAPHEEPRFDPWSGTRSHVPQVKIPYVITNVGDSACCN